MDPPFEMAFSMDDGPRYVIHDSLRQQSVALAMAGQVWEADELEKAEKAMGWTYGWYVHTCSPVSTQLQKLAQHGSHFRREQDTDRWNGCE